MGNGRAEPWLIAYTRQLRVRLPSSAGYISALYLLKFDPDSEILLRSLSCAHRTLVHRCEGSLSRWRLSRSPQGGGIVD